MSSFQRRSLVAALLAASCGCGDASAPAPVEDGPGHRMRALLAEVAARTREENPYLGDGAVVELRRRAGELTEDARPIERWQVLSGLGMEELRLGRIPQAIRALEAARKTVSEMPEGEQQRGEAISSYQLGLAYLRWGETQNCVERHTSQSCILPIEEPGFHVNEEGSRRAIAHFRRVIEVAKPLSPDAVCARWLLNLAYMTVGGYPHEVPDALRIPPEVFEPEEPFPRFPDVASDLGLNTVDLAGGAVVEDYDGDGRLDIFTSTWDVPGGMHLFARRGDGSFDERTESAGLAGLMGGLNLVQADYDDDGDIDVLVLRGGWIGGAGGRQPNSLLRNDGRGNFHEATFEAGLGKSQYPTQTAAWADYDLDGDLDLYIGAEATPGDPLPGRLFRNGGDGTFVDVTRSAGVENLRYAKAVMWGDYDGDRWPDLYVSNLGGPNRLYHNEGNGTFVDVAPDLGVTGPRESFTGWFWDFDNDGALDLYVSSYPSARLYPVVASYLGMKHWSEPAALYRGDGRGGFEDVTFDRGLDLVSMTMGANFGDLDNDGFLDFYLGTGYPGYDGLTPNVMYRNRSGKGFSDVTTAGGFGHAQKGHGVVFADLDDDGDQDVFEQMGGAFPGDGFGNVLYENPGFGHHWIKIRLVGTESNRFGVGARLRIGIEDPDGRRSIYRELGTGGSFGGNPLIEHVGLGAAEKVELLEVFWPRTGRTQRFEHVPADVLVEIREDAGELRRWEPKPAPFAPPAGSGDPAHRGHAHGDSRPHAP